MSLIFKNHFHFYKASFTKDGGKTETYPTNEDIYTLEIRKEEIMISMSGYLSEEVNFGKHDFGSYSDMEKVYDLTTRMVERSFVDGYYSFIPPYQDNNDRYETKTKRTANEKRILNYIKKFEDETRDLIKKYNNEIIKISEYIYKNGFIKQNDLKTIGILI